MASCSIATGGTTVEACIAKIWDQADSAARQVVESIRDGVYTAESLLDNDGRTLDKPLRIKVRVRGEADRSSRSISPR